MFFPEFLEVTYRYNYASNSTLNALDKDTVCFRGKEQEKESSFLGTLAKIGIGAAAIVAGLGCAKKYKLVDKIPDGTFKDYLTTIEQSNSSETGVREEIYKRYIMVNYNYNGHNYYSSLDI